MPFLAAVGGEHSRLAKARYCVLPTGYHESLPRCKTLPAVRTPCRSQEPIGRRAHGNHDGDAAQQLCFVRSSQHFVKPARESVPELASTARALCCRTWSRCGKRETGEGGYFWRHQLTSKPKSRRGSQGTVAHSTPSPTRPDSIRAAVRLPVLRCPTNRTLESSASRKCQGAAPASRGAAGRRILRAFRSVHYAASS